MAKDSFGPIEDGVTYTHQQIGKVIGRSDRWVKDFIKNNNVRCADLGNGLMVVSGRLWRLAIEKLSQPDGEHE